MTHEQHVVHVIVDDQEVRDAIIALLNSVDLEGQAYASAEQFLQADVPDCPSCIVLDVRMPEMSGIELQRHLAIQGTGIPVIIVSGHAEVAMAVDCVQQGAVTFLEKPIKPQILLDWVHKAIRQHAEDRQAQEEHNRLESRFEQLTQKERDIMGYIVVGKTTKQIAAALGLNPKTVEYHRARLMDTMEADSVAELVRAAMCLEPNAYAHRD